MPKRKVIDLEANSGDSGSKRGFESASFYNPSKRIKQGYLSPLERAALRQKQTSETQSDENINLTVSPKLQKNSPRHARSTLKKYSKKSSIQTGAPKLTGASSNKEVEQEKNEKKFFKNKSKKSKVIINKNGALKFQVLNSPIKNKKVRKQRKKATKGKKTVAEQPSSTNDKVDKNISSPKSETQSKVSADEGSIDIESDVDSKKQESPKTAKDIYSETSDLDVDVMRRDSEFNSSYTGVPKKKVQMILDAGQKRIGMQICNTCGMTYFLGNKEDEALHAKLHAKNPFKFPGWKTEKVMQFLPNGDRIIVITSDNKAQMRKLKQIESVLNTEFGTPNEVEQNYCVTYLYISDKNVVGYCVATKISKANRIIDSNDDGLIETSETEGPARCGIYRIWVHRDSRRQKVATKMLNCIRQSYILGQVLEKDDLAFSDPTNDGNCLATKYFGTKNYLVYKKI
ncbi:DgyrCDS1426 [Dimorphilus gyrociliatus]|uniref:DgyrCDS1426 n=1 Tax=Dimorphilus gyrociliatus TaxID=2664684 RepID=A0A7I8VA64_9ANNE|nr:DgyrCDS1426 [Dimorphilus gyrociliatus]